MRGILACLNDLAAKDPAMPMLGGGDRWFDVRSVLAIAEHVGSSLRRMGLPDGACVFHPKRNLSSALMLFGLRCAGLVTVLAEPKQSPEDLLQNTDADLSVAAYLEQTGRTQFSIFRTDGDRRRETIDMYSLMPTDGLHASASPAVISRNTPATAEAVRWTSPCSTCVHRKTSTWAVPSTFSAN